MYDCTKGSSLFVRCNTVHLCHIFSLNCRSHPGYKNYGTSLAFRDFWRRCCFRVYTVVSFDFVFFFNILILTLDILIYFEIVSVEKQSMDMAR